jgi:hypothetical protein
MEYAAVHRWPGAPFFRCSRFETLLAVVGELGGLLEFRIRLLKVTIQISDRGTGNPSPRHISTSYAERQNLTLGMKMRRFTRLTNAFSKKVDDRRTAVALHYMHYNFCRIHSALRVTPAMAAGISDHIWSIDEVVSLLENSVPKTAA